MASKTRQTAKGEIEYAEHGSGKPVLFVHGSPGGCDQGLLMSEFLVDAGFRVIAVSRPGYLGTPLTDENKEPSVQADLYAALMGELGFQSFSVMCWSGGGPSSYRLCVQYPGRINKLVAIAAVSKAYKFKGGLESGLMYGRVGRWLFTELAGHMQQKLVEETLGAEGKLAKEDLKQLTNEVMDDETKRNFVMKLVETLTERKKGLKNDHKQFPLITDLELDKIHIPALLVHGIVDTDVPPEYSEYAKQQLPRAEIIHIDKGTHIAVWTDTKSKKTQLKITTFLQ